MATWVRGTSIVYKKARTSSTAVPSLIEMLEKSKSRDASARHRGLPHLRSGECPLCAAAQPQAQPCATRADKHILLSVSVATTPRVLEEERLSIEYLSDDFIRLFVGYGYMEEPNVPRALGLARKLGVKFDIMARSLRSRRSFRASRETGMPLWQDHLFITLSKSGTDAASFYRLPSNRVVELGEVFVI